jgi:RNA polymerase sigma-70 factor (ECF subfamily)
MSEETPFRELLHGARSGDQEAARALAAAFEPEVRRAARGAIHGLHLGNLLDSMDVSQAVWAEFFVRAARGQFELNESEELRKLLVTMARNHARDESRRQRAARRDQGRVGNLSQHCLGELADDGPTPSRIVSARELLAEVFQRLSPDDRHLFEQRALGQEWTTLAKQRGVRAVTLRKRVTRAVNRILTEMGLLEER